MSRALAISMGDPAGIGPEIIVKALAHPELAQRCIVFGDPGILEARAQALALPVPARIEAVTRLHAAPPLGAIGAPAGDAAFRYIVAATEAVRADRAAALITAPISKEALKLAGHHYPGHTELLAELAGGVEVRMMLANEELRTVLVTVHMALRDAIAAISTATVLRTIEIADRGLRLAGIGRPRLAVAGLNPHAGEGGQFGREEIEQIAPAIAAARAAGIDASGPWAPDTVFMQARGFARFDAVIAMYHDQGLIPVKYLGIEQGVNLTLGLPFVRTSPDHGTAFDIAGQGRADPASLCAAIRMAERLCADRASG